uniref:Ig-like domain-containing protein n=1 Tax=Knipowitschia caucasica TaxID=637954 RepID=A0AAV2MAL7_KNICA
MKNMLRYDQRSFTCSASNPVISDTFSAPKLSISNGPDAATVKTFPLLHHYEEGSDVSLSCSADSRPVAQIKWFFNGEMLSSTEAQLPLMNIQMSQSGNYSCQAFNSKTLRYSTSEPALVSVLNYTEGDGPYEVTVTCPNKLEAGQSFAMLCSAESVPVATYSWKFNDDPLVKRTEMVLVTIVKPEAPL